MKMVLADFRVPGKVVLLLRFGTFIINMYSEWRMVGHGREDNYMSLSLKVFHVIIID